MKVYVLLGYEEYNYLPIGVFTTREKAEKYILDNLGRYNANYREVHPPQFYYESRIVEFEVDTIIT